MKPLFLVGFMGSGKSTFGRLLADGLNRKFIDLDQWIEEKEKRSIEAIFSHDGESYFRKIEKEALQSVTALKEPLVIATGGGTPCFFDNMNWMLKNGITVYLEASEEELYQRIMTDSKQRPLLKGLNADEIRPFLSLLLDKRRIYYEKSTLKVAPNPLNLNEVIHILKKAITS